MRRFALVNAATGERTEIEKAVTIGRREGDLVVDDLEMSQRHAVIHIDAGELLLTDLESTNGCFVDERRVSGSHYLLDGQVVRLGQTRWQVTITGELAAGVTRVPGV